MAKSTGHSGLGVVLELVETGISEDLIPVGQITRMEVGGRSLNAIDSTHLSSPQKYQEFVSGLKSGLPWSGTLVWDPVRYQTLISKFEARAKVLARVNFTAVGVPVLLVANGFFTDFGNKSIAPSEIIVHNFEFRPSGKISFVKIQGSDGMFSFDDGNNSYMVSLI